MKRHAIRIESPHGIYMTTKIYLDGQELRGAYAAHVDIDNSQSPDVRVTLVLSVRELIVDGEGAVTLVGHPRKLPQLTVTDEQEEAE